MWDEILRNSQNLNKLVDASFKSIDMNGNGLIELEELEEIMSYTAEDMGIQKPSKEEVKDVMKEMDKDNNGVLTKEDFKILVEQVIRTINKSQPNT